MLKNNLFQDILEQKMFIFTKKQTILTKTHARKGRGRATGMNNTLAKQTRRISTVTHPDTRHAHTLQRVRQSLHVREYKIQSLPQTDTERTRERENEKSRETSTTNTDRMTKHWVVHNNVTPTKSIYFFYCRHLKGVFKTETFILKFLFLEIFIFFFISVS